MLHSVRVKARRGTELLDELAGVLPNLYSFNRSEFIRILNRMSTLYGKTNIPVACGVQVVVCHVESSYLNDEEARLVHCITGIHIDRAASIVKAKAAA